MLSLKHAACFPDIFSTLRNGFSFVHIFSCKITKLSNSLNDTNQIQDLNKHIVVTRMSMRSGPGRGHKPPVQPHYGHKIGQTLGHKVSSSF